MKGAIPILSYPSAAVCLTLNCILPGVGMLCWLLKMIPHTEKSKMLENVFARKQSQLIPLIFFLYNYLIFNGKSVELPLHVTCNPPKSLDLTVKS